MGPVVFAGLTEAGIITWRDFKNGRTILGLPVPGDYLAVFIVFGGLFMLASTQNGKNLAGVMGWGLVVATALNVINPTFVKSAGPQATTTGGGAGGTNAAKGGTSQAPGTTTAGGRGG